MTGPSIIIYKDKSTLRNGVLAQFYTWAGDKPPDYLEKLKPIKTEIHPWINFVWYDRPSPGVPSEFFAVVWKAYIYIPRTGQYRFYVTTDDGTRLWIDDKLIIDAWKDQPPTTYVSEPLMLEKGYHRLKYYFYNRYVFAEAVLGWIPPAGEPGVIPPEYFWISIGDKIVFKGLPDKYGIEISCSDGIKKCISRRGVCSIKVSWDEGPIAGIVKVLDDKGEIIHRSPREMLLWPGDEITIMVGSTC